MHLYDMVPAGKLKEFMMTPPFLIHHAEAVIEDWLEQNLDGILEDCRLPIIDRQVTTNLGSVIDLIALDRIGDVVVVKLKRVWTQKKLSRLLVRN